MKTHFEKPGSNPLPGLIGRIIRLAAGLAILYLVFPPFIKYYEAFTRPRDGWGMPGGLWHIGVLVGIYFLPVMIDRGFTVHWGHRAWYGFGVLAVGAVALDFAVYGGFWAPPLGWLLLLNATLVLGFLGISFVFAGLFATPG